MKFAFRRWERENPEDSEETLFGRYYQEMIEANGFTSRNVRLSISGQSSFQRLSKLPPVLGSRSAITRAVAFEASQTVPYQMDDVEWDYQLIHHEWDEPRMEEQEDGTQTEVMEHQEEYEALFVAMKTEQVKVFSDVIEDSGKNLLSVEIAPIALFNAAIATQVKEDECVLMLNIGCRGSSLMIADHQRAFIRNIPIAGESITDRVAKEFNVGMAEAEDLKRRHGFVALGGAYEDPESELAATISKLARNAMTRLHGEVSRSISVWRAQHGGNAPVRVLLSGGGSVMMYMLDFFQEKLRLPVEFLNTFPAISIAETVDKNELQKYAPMFQELIGLSLHNVTRCPIDISLLPRYIREQRELDRKVPYFYASAAALVVCLLIFVSGVINLRNFGKQRVESAKQEVERVLKKQKEIKLLDGNLGSIRSQYEKVLGFLNERSQWVNLLSHLQSLIPDSMWLVTLEGQGDSTLTASGNQGNRSDDHETVKVVKSDPAKHLNLTDCSNLLEVKKLHLVGYTLAGRSNTDVEEQFRRNLKNSPYFEEKWVMTESKTSHKDNLTYFDITLTIKPEKVIKRK